MRKFWLGFYLFPPESGSGSGSAENGATPGTDASVTSGSASESLIAAALASESSSGGSATETEAEKVAKATGIDISGDTSKPGAKAGTATPDATGQPDLTGLGQAPPNRIEAAVKNARAAAVAETEARFSWAKDLNPDDVRDAIRLTSALAADTTQFLQVLAAAQGFQLVKPGERVESGEKPVVRKPFALPEPQLHSEDGKGAYSSDQVAVILKDFADDLKAEFGGQLKPLLTAREEGEKAAAVAATREEIRQTVTDAMTDLRSKPFFQVEKDGQKIDSPKIMEYLLAIPAKTRQRNPIAALHSAYATYMEKDILPNYGKISEQRVRDENAKKAAGSGIARPGGSSGNGDSANTPIRGVSGLAAKMEQMWNAQGGSGA